MTETVDRFAGAGGPSEVAFADPFVQGDAIVVLCCTLALLCVVAAQYARHRRRMKTLATLESDRMRTRHGRTGGIRSDRRLGYDAGLWGDGS